MVWWFEKNVVEDITVLRFILNYLLHYLKNVKHVKLIAYISVEYSNSNSEPTFGSGFILEIGMPTLLSHRRKMQTNSKKTFSNKQRNIYS